MVANDTQRLCPHCLEGIADGSETATIHNGFSSRSGRIYPDQVMHTDCGEEYRDAYEITWPNGERSAVAA